MNTPQWLVDARSNAWKYLTLFVNNPGIEKVVHEFDSTYLSIKDVNERIDYLAKLAGEHWDFRRGRERWEITETFAMDESDSELGRTIHEGTRSMEMSKPSTATLFHYSILGILGGAFRSPYNRLKYGLEQDVTYDTLVFLGSEREVLPLEQEQTKDYAPGARTEFELGVGAIKTLMGDQLADDEYEEHIFDGRVLHMKTKENLPILVLSAPVLQGGKRANTADTYDFLRRIEEKGLIRNPTKNMLFATAGMYRYAQYFDAVREISLKTGVDIEIVGFAAAYSGMKFKASQFLQELKSAADAAVL
ncbi:MAG TPA: hypothetical protein VLF20_05765, partial [Patescibacteria group bacterium]|nr:hypothetical protein [Patescibacteria group bacterium]